MTKYAFIHIPKTAGSVFWGVITHHCDLRASPHMLMTHYFSGEERFQGDWDLHGGHTFYPLLKKVMPPDTKYMTLLRHPVNRVYSHWNHLIVKNVYSRYGFEDEIGFSEFIRDPRALGIASNFQARYLSYEPILPITTPQLSYNIIAEQSDVGMDEDTLEKTAKKNLKEFALVGRQEEFANAVMRACMLMGFPPPFDIPLKHVDYSDVISEEDKEYLLEMNKIDLDLWQGFDAKEKVYTVHNKMVEEPPHYHG